jgi:hypothetical protein
MRDPEFKAIDENGDEYFLDVPSYMGLNEIGQEKMCSCELSDQLKQFTGKRDKNDVKVYDGDRLYNGYVFANIVYSDDLAAFIGKLTHMDEWKYLHVLITEGFYVA